jgi:hypothetical protein
VQRTNASAVISEFNEAVGPPDNIAAIPVLLPSPRLNGIQVLVLAALGVPMCASCAQPEAIAAVIPQSEALALRREIEQRGSLRVIVAVTVTGDAASAAENVRAAQDRVLQALRGTRHEVIHLYRSIPQLVLAVEPDALDVLLSSEWVRSVVPDSPEPAPVRTP